MIFDDLMHVIPSFTSNYAGNSVKETRPSTVQTSTLLFLLAREMMRDLWESKRTSARESAVEGEARVHFLGHKIEQLMGRIVPSDSIELVGGGEGISWRVCSYGSAAGCRLRGDIANRAVVPRKPLRSLGFGTSRGQEIGATSSICEQAILPPE